MGIRSCDLDFWPGVGSHMGLTRFHVSLQILWGRVCAFREDIFATFWAYEQIFLFWSTADRIVTDFYTLWCPKSLIKQVHVGEFWDYVSSTDLLWVYVYPRPLGQPVCSRAMAFVPPVLGTTTVTNKRPVVVWGAGVNVVHWAVFSLAAVYTCDVFLVNLAYTSHVIDSREHGYGGWHLLNRVVSYHLFYVYNYFI